MNKIIVVCFLLSAIIARAQNIFPSGLDSGSFKATINVNLHQCSLPTGIGDADQRILGIKVYSSDSTASLTQVAMKMTGTSNISDVSSVKLYYTADSSRFFIGGGSTLLASESPSAGAISLGCNQVLMADTNYFWIVYDVSPSATEGHLLDAVVDSVVAGGSAYTATNVSGARTILLTNSLLFSCNDLGSKNYRIPALVVAPDGSLVTATDKRWNNVYDLPNDIDILIRRSTDQGETWSAPLTIAGGDTTLGFGDAALCVDKTNGNIICLMASGPGLWDATAENPLRIMKCVSTDNGLTWSSPVDITDMIYGAGCSNSITQTWWSAFVASGSFVQFSNGRLAAVIAARKASSTTLYNYMIYSDDHGVTWNISTDPAETSGDEAKLVERADSTILMSIRNPGYRRFNTSADWGMTWGNAYTENEITDPNCNGDILRYTCVKDGYLKNRILHSIPFASNRSNVSVLISYDEGSTWPVKKNIYSGSSAYSSLCVLPDGTIGIYYEVGEYEVYQMYFVRFSLDWLTDGADHFSPAGIDDNGPEQGRLQLFPNPSDGIINIIAADEFSDSFMELINAEGKRIYRGRVSEMAGNAPQRQFDLSVYPAGLYFVHLTGSAHSEMIKVVRP